MVIRPPSVQQLTILFTAIFLLTARARPQDITLHGTISPEKLSLHETQTFLMPPGIERLTATLDSPGLPKGMYVTVGLFDPERYRGEGRQTFTLSTVDATGPYIPGPLPAGTWKVSFGFNWVAPTAHGEYTLHLHLSHQLDPETYPVLNPNPGWYRGDLHAHTGRTDAACKSQSGATNVPCPPYRLFDAAARQHLDFLAVTDHNTQSHFDELSNDQPYFDQLLLLAAEEVTTTQGHANIWGTESFLDYRVAPTGYTVNDLFDRAHQLHALVSINHAGWPDDARCPGCGWAWASITDFDKVDAIEVVNGYHEHGSWFTPPPGNGIPFWEAQLALQQRAQGHRITAVGGGDEHRAGEQLPLGDGVGIPTTVVYARQLSQPALLEGIRAGHVYIKLSGPEGPALLLTSGSAIMGDHIAAPKGSVTEIQAASPSAPTAQIRFLVDGHATDPSLITQSTPAQATLHLPSDGTRHWVRAELLDATGTLVTLTNPLYLNWP